MWSTLNHRQKEKKRKERVWTKRKDDEKNQIVHHWCFWFFTNAHMCEAWKTGEHVDKKGVMVEEWKARRKEWKKKRKKKGKKGKCGFGKSPFCFCLTVSLPLPFFPPHPPHHTTWRIGTHHHMQTGPCAVLPFFGSGQRDTLHHPHPTLHHLTSHNTHQPTQHRHSSWFKQQCDDNCQWDCAC